ncbi:MAG: hypothetical protein KGS72_05040 [Cyanobacteria bacterium REEB67]|nr:hypothetical protein [Cyanobacteria bacterium REEB67]
MHSVKTKIYLLFLALAVVMLAPFKALSTPVNAIPEDPCVVVSSCCAKMVACCCEMAPARQEPTDMNSAALPAPAPKFVAIKGSGRIISQSLPKPLYTILAQGRIVPLLAVSAVISRPLYILNRALLI